MARPRHPSLLSLVLLAGCMDLPEAPPEAEPLTADAAVASGLSADGGGLARPPTGEPYTGPECELARPSAGGMDGAAGVDGAPAAGASGPEIAGADGSAGAPSGAAGEGGEPANATPGARRPAAHGDIVITELMPNPEAVRDDAGEWFELYNPSASQAFDLTGCAINDGSTTVRMLNGPGRIEPGGYAVVARSAEVGFTPDATLVFSLANAADTLVLLCDGVEIDRVAYGAGYPLAPAASLSLDPDATDAVLNDDARFWCLGTVAYGSDLGTPGAPNPDCDEADAGSE